MSETLVPVRSYYSDPTVEIVEVTTFIREAKDGTRRDSAGTAYPVIDGEVLLDYVILCSNTELVPVNAPEILWIPT